MRSQSAPIPSSIDGRYQALDALRAWAMLLGVAFHASISYMRGEVPGLLWGVHDTARSLTLDIVFWWIHGFHLHLFFLISGFTAVLVCRSRGVAGFMRQRAHRLLVPLLLGVPTILAVTLYIWGLGWYVSERCTLRELLRTNFPPSIRSQMWGPAHLWFLEELFVMSAVFAGLYALRCRGSREDDWPATFRVRMPRWFNPVVLAAPTALFLWFEPSPVMTHANSFVPDVARMCYYGLFFAAGAWLFGHRHAVASLAPRGMIWLALSAPALAAVLWFLPEDLRREATGWPRVGLSLAVALLAWTSLFGFLGVFWRQFNEQHSAQRRGVVAYLADASFWIYLSHFPIVGLAQIDLYDVPWPAEIKFLATLAVTLAVCLASYQTMVRYTWIGALLHGRRTRPTTQSSVKAHSEPVRRTA